MQSASNSEMENSTDNGKEPLFVANEQAVKKEPVEEDENSNQNPLNGSIVDPAVDLDYEDDFIAEKQDDCCKKLQDEDAEKANTESDAEKLIVYCPQDGIESPIIENQSPEKKSEYSESPDVDDKDEGEISDDDEDGEELDGEVQDEEELEEGEVKEPVTAATQQIARQVCRFFNNGNCTWGNQCRFLHLSLKDHGCYSMFGTPSNKAYIPHIIHANDMPLVIPPHHDLRSNREIRRPPPSKPPNPPPPPAQTAWDYGLQCAKEALEISNQRKKQEFDYEDKKLNLKTEEVIDNKENYDYVKPYRQQSENFHLNKYEEPKDSRDVFPPSRKSWIKEGELQRPMKRNKSRDKQLSEIQSARPRGDEWRDPWRRSLSPKNRQKRKRDVSSCSSISSDSCSTRSSTSPYSSRSSSVSSRSASYDKPYHKNKNFREDQRKVSSSHDMRQTFAFKEKSLYTRKLQRPSRMSQQRNVYRSPSSKSLSRSHSPSLSNVSSASSCSSSSHARNRNEKVVEKVVIKPKPKKKPQPTRTLFEEMQRLVQHRQRSDGEKVVPSAPCATTSYQSVPNIKVIKKEPTTPEPEKVETEHVKSIGVRRIKLMRQLQAVEDAIARKRQKI